MVLSRSLPLLRGALLKPGQSTPVHLAKTAVRNSSEGRLEDDILESAYPDCAYNYAYRYRLMGDPPGSEAIERGSDIAMTFFWTWVCYHMITKYEHIIGEYDYPDTSKWTDEELGVPPDDYEPPSRS